MMTAPARRRGFSFVEILFAIAVLSIGMMGVAAAVYVGVDQTKSTLEDTAAAAVARQAAATLAQVMTRDNTQETGVTMRSFPESASSQPGALQQAVAGSQISAADPRYAFVPVYRRAEDDLTAQITIVVVHAEARPAFDFQDLTKFDLPLDQYPPTLYPCQAAVDITNNQIRIDTPQTGSGRVAAGAIVVLSAMSDPTLNGRAVRVAGPGDNGRWLLAPGQDLTGVSGSQVGSAYVIGRGYADVTHPRQGYAGASQAVAVYSAIITLR